MDEAHLPAAPGNSDVNVFIPQALIQGFTSPRPRPLRIVLPGGSGQVGQMLARYPSEARSPGDRPGPAGRIRRPGRAGSLGRRRQIGPWTETLEGADVCINLSGRSVKLPHERDQPAGLVRLAHWHHAPAQ